MESQLRFRANLNDSDNITVKIVICQENCNRLVRITRLGLNRSKNCGCFYSNFTSGTKLICHIIFGISVTFVISYLSIFEYIQKCDPIFRIYSRKPFDVLYGVLYSQDENARFPKMAGKCNFKAFSKFLFPEFDLEF